MKAILKKRSFYGIALAAAASILGYSMQSVGAWTEPGAAAPGGNVGAPINTSNTAQGKLGSFGVGTTTPTNKFNVVNGSYMTKMDGNGMAVSNGTREFWIGVHPSSNELTIRDNSAGGGGQDRFILDQDGKMRLKKTNPYEGKGDADGNGTVNEADAKYVLNMAVGLGGSCSMNICDMNSDGNINVADSLIILRIALGLIQNELTISPDGIYGNVNMGNNLTVAGNTILGKDPGYTAGRLKIGGNIVVGMEYGKGDVDKNGVIDTADALSVLRKTVGLSGLCDSNFYACDLDNNGVVDVTEAQIVLRIAVGLNAPYQNFTYYGTSSKFTAPALNVTSDYGGYTETLELLGRDIYTAADQTMHLNWGNASGNVQIGGQGEAKALYIGSGGNNFYGDATNLAARMSGDFYVQKQNGDAANVIANDYYIAAAGRWASQGPRCNWTGWKIVHGDQGCDDDVAIQCTDNNVTRFSYVDCGNSIPSNQP